MGKLLELRRKMLAAQQKADADKIARIRVREKARAAVRNMAPARIRCQMERVICC